jgi:hypothetical protein
VEHELFTLPEHMCLNPVVSGVRVTPSLVLCVSFVDRCLVCPFVLFLLPIVLSVLLRFTDSDYSLVSSSSSYNLFIGCLLFNVQWEIFQTNSEREQDKKYHKINMKEKYDNQVKGHRLKPGQGSSTSAGKV